MRFEFATAGRVLFGAGALRELPGAAPGVRPLVVTGRHPERAAAVLEAFPGAPDLPVSGEPALRRIREGVALARERGCDFIIGFGGGSAIDAAKAIAILVPNSGEPLDYLEVVGRGKPLTQPPLPCVAIPTTAGAGSEATRNAVLLSEEHRVKASLRHVAMLPRLALVDPELTLSLPPAVTAATGLDALTQLIEPFVSRRANAFTDMLCLEGMRRVARWLVRAVEHGHDLEARTGMAMAALLGGMCLGNAGLGAVHGFAAPLGGMFPAPHGAVCAALLPYVCEENARHGSEALLERYAVIARILTGRPEAGPGDGIEWMHRTCEALRIPKLGAYGVRPEDVPEVVERAIEASSMKGNPVVLSRQQLSAVLGAAL